MRSSHLQLHYSCYAFQLPWFCFIALFTSKFRMLWMYPLKYTKKPASNYTSSQPKFLPDITFPKFASQTSTQLKPTYKCLKLNDTSLMPHWLLHFIKTSFIKHLHFLGHHLICATKSKISQPQTVKLFGHKIQNSTFDKFILRELSLSQIPSSWIFLVPNKSKKTKKVLFICFSSWPVFWSVIVPV